MNVRQDEAQPTSWMFTSAAMSMPSAQSSGLDDPKIDEMIQSSDGDPWTALRSNPQFLSPLQYRNPILSDDGTAPDSTHGDSQLHYPDEFASYVGTRQEVAGTAQMQQMLCGIHLGNPGPHMPSMPGPGSAADVASTFSTATVGTGMTGATGQHGRLKCSQCKQECASPSKLRKHMQRHSRPHCCTYANCAKSRRGFSTANDLARHKASVHKEAGTGYKCQHEDCARAAQPKTWPRKDNFRTHLLKVHRIDVSAEMVDSQYLEVVPENDAQNVTPSNNTTIFEQMHSVEIELPDTSSYAAESIIMDSDHVQYENQQVAVPILPDTSCFPTFPAQPDPFPSMQADISFGAESGQSIQTTSFNEQPFATQPMPIAEAEAETFSSTMVVQEQYATTHQSPPSQPTSGIDETHLMYSPRAGSIFSSSFPRGSFTAASSQPPGQTTEPLCHEILVRDGWNDSQLVSLLKSFPAELLDQALRAKSEAAADAQVPDETIARVNFTCEKCSKVCNRACELKKHMKRHERPYGCTVKSCGKNFGSKNDWKRHESGQHDAVEAWACDDEGCIAIFDSRFTFMQHLMEAHDMRHSEDIKSRSQSCRIGQQCDARFWCGFCGQVIEIEDMMGQDDASSGSYWSRRFDHIDGHLFGKGGLEQKGKAAWRFLEDETKRGDQPGRLEQMSTAGSVRSAATSNGTPIKRKGLEHTDSRPRKRADGQWAAC